MRLQPLTFLADPREICQLAPPGTQQKDDVRPTCENGVVVHWETRRYDAAKPSAIAAKRNH